jgi:hypothetical protein
MKCVGFERLMNFLDGRLSDEDGRLVAEHLEQGCGRCEADRRWYGLLTSMKRGPAQIEPPEWVFKRAVRLFEKKPQTESAGKRSVRAAARLIFDSLSQPALAGARSGLAPSRHLLYAVEDYSIDLRIAATDAADIDLIGQVLSTSESGFDMVAGIAIELAREGETVSSVVTDEVGVFIIRRLGSGEYNLHIDARGMIIEVVGLPISPVT